jgi:hypothetical protein
MMRKIRDEKRTLNDEQNNQNIKKEETTKKERRSYREKSK